MSSIRASLGALVLNEVRVRARRVSTLVCLLAVIIISWSMVVDQRNGFSMMVIDKHAVVYNSAALSLGTSVLASMLFGLGAFYLARGRTRDDLRYGVGSVLAATPISNASLLLARWIGAMAYLCTLVLALMATTMLLQLVRGVGPIEPFTYLQTYALLLLPTLAMAASIAVVCDSTAPLMGKGGDVIYFSLWVAQFSIMPIKLVKNDHDLGMLGMFDVSGVATVATRIGKMYGSSSLSLGGSRFDPALALNTIENFWTSELVLARLVAMVIAMLPLLLAVMIFHRYSPDKVRAVSTSNRGSLLGWINKLLRPATVVLRPLFGIAAKLPGVLGQALADAALTLMANPALFLATVVIFVFGCVAPTTGLGGVLIAAMFCWGILISDLSVRDFQSATHAMTAAVPGGAMQRYLRHVSVTLALGLTLSAPVLWRWSNASPTRALALVSGLLMLSAAASLFGRLTRSGRTFLGLYLFGLYLATQVKGVAWFDVVGFNGFATAQTIGTYTLIGVAMVAVGSMVTRRTNT